MITRNWPVTYPQDSPCDALAVLSPEERAVMEEMAATYLWHWTAKAFGVQPVVLRPCQDSAWARMSNTFWGRSPMRYQGGSGSGAPWFPALIGGAWFNITCGTCLTGSCSCSSMSSIRLPGPVQEITAVTIDGTVMPSTSYRVDNESVLVRLDDAALGWPTRQDLDDPATDVGTWQVEYLRGAPVPPGGSMAAGVLACELAKALVADPTCRLPQRLASITRQGVTIAVLDTFDGVAKGYTGIWVIDSWVASVTRPPRPGAVFSVDRARPRNRVTTS